MKKLLSVFISIIIAACAMLAAVPAMAATPSYCFTIKVSGTQYNSVAKTTLSQINAERKENGLEEISFDSSLEAFAKLRAAEMIIGGEIKHTETEYEEKCADSTPMEFIYPQYGKRIFTESSDNYTDFFSSLQALSTGYENIKSIGIAAFKYNKTDSYYAIFSEDESAAEYSDFSNEAYSKSVNVSYRYTKRFKLSSTAVKDKYYKLYITCLFAGYCTDYISVPNSQLTYKSSNSKVFKIVDSKGYIKGTGKYYIKLLDKSSVSLCKFEGLSAKINLKAPTLYVKSAKKKQLTAQWRQFEDGTGYQLQYSLKKNMKGAKTIKIKGFKNSKKTIKKLKSKKKYYVRVRAYKDQGGGEKVYTKWSKIKSVKVK